MKIIADTNVLVRAVVQDDKVQSAIAARTLAEASLIAVTLPSLCEFVWVLRRVYGFSIKEIGEAIRSLAAAPNVVVNRLAVEAGLGLLDAGGDFADGVIAFEGRWLGAETFVSFDKVAISLLSAQGISARLP